MPANTAKHRIPYAVGTDRVRDISQIHRSQSERLDAIIPGENELIIGGKRYKASGTVPAFKVLPFTASGNWYYSSVEITPPYTPPTGYRFHYYILETSGFSLLGNGNNDSQTGKYRARIIQVANSTTEVVKSIGWTLVKEN